MIPKIIHYCWFSGERPNRFIRNCIKSWRRAMPDYEIRLWDGNSFDFDSVPFVRDAIKARKWAFAADYVRLYALYTGGGIYLDSDVKTFKSFDCFLDNRFFIGTEPLDSGKVEMESAIMGSEAGHPFLKKCLDYYADLEFGDLTTVPRIMTAIASREYGYEAVNRNQLLDEGIRVYDRTYFGHCWGTKPADYYAIHYFNASWLDSQMFRGPVYKFCKSNDIMDLYLGIQKFLLRIRGAGK